MTLLDWCILWLPIAAVLGVATSTIKYNKSVVDFIAAGRCAGRYLLATAKGESGSAAITAIALFQMTSKTGFAFQFWAPLNSIIPIIIAITGWVVYRFRETRALTAGQFFEMRYSRRFRLFMGGVAFLSGIMNYGIFPAVSSKFFVYYLDLPLAVSFFHFDIPTWQLIAFAYLCCCLFFVLTGGQISILITDCLEGLFSQIAYVIIIVALLLIFGWHHMAESLSAAPPHKSMMNPFDMGGTQDFNIYFILIGLFGAVYTVTIQGGFTAAARNPHELRMSGILGSWRGFAFTLMRTILAICAVTFLINPHFAGEAASTHAQLQSIADPAIRDQMQVPVAASHFLPMGIKGLFCSIMLMGVLTGDAGALLSYGSMFVQDIVLPLRKTAMTPADHLRYLRWAVVGVAVFAFFFSSLFRQTQYIQLYWQITGAIYAGGAGAVVIGGLYWKRGTTLAAWITICIGAVIALTGIVLQQIYPNFPIHGQYIALITMLTSIVAYIVISLLTCRENFNMDRMLHRGVYAVAGEQKEVAPPIWKRFNPAKIIGIDEEFTFWDKVIAFSIFGWVMTTFVISMIGTVWNLFQPWSTATWINYWFIFGLVVPLVATVITTVWFTIGGAYEMRTFFRSLNMEKRDARDDGTVGLGHP